MNCPDCVEGYGTSNHLFMPVLVENPSSYIAVEGKPGNFRLLLALGDLSNCNRTDNRCQALHCLQYGNQTAACRCLPA